MSTMMTTQGWKEQGDIPEAELVTSAYRAQCPGVTLDCLMRVARAQVPEATMLLVNLPGYTSPCAVHWPITPGVSVRLVFARPAEAMERPVGIFLKGEMTRGDRARTIGPMAARFAAGLAALQRA